MTQSSSRLFLASVKVRAAVVRAGAVPFSATASVRVERLSRLASYKYRFWESSLTCWHLLLLCRSYQALGADSTSTLLFNALSLVPLARVALTTASHVHQRKAIYYNGQYTGQGKH